MDSPTPATDAHCGPSAPVRRSVGVAHSSWPHRPAPRAPRRSPADLRQLARFPCRLSHPHTPALRGTAPRLPPAARATEQLIERQIRRDIQYPWILRLILRQNTVHLFTPRQPADGHPEDVERPWSTSMEPENVHVK